VIVGEYLADLLVDGAVIVELKAAKHLDDIHVAQCLNYLRGADLRVGLLVNFGTPKIEIRRIVNRF
jgi:GxxExxY protein